METLEFVQKPVDGKLVIELPEEWKDREVAIKITDPVTIPPLEEWNALPKEEKLRILQHFAGSARYPDTPIDKYEVYEQ